jgi:hypothetical protein
MSGRGWGCLQMQGPRYRSTADCNDIDPYAYHGHTPRYDCALIYGSESRLLDTSLPYSEGR